MKKLLLICSCLLIGICSLQAQNKNSKLQIGIGADMLAYRSSTASSKLAIGQQIQLWAAYPLNTQNSLKIAAGYRRMNGFDEQAVQVDERTFPNEFQTVITTKTLRQLAYWDVNLLWQHDLNNSPWTIFGGARLGAIAQVEGNEQTTTWATGYEVRIMENSFTASSDNGSETRATAFGEEGIEQLDYGLLIGVQYQITRGLHANAGYYLGLNNVFADDLMLSTETLKLSNFSLGFSARIY